MFLSSRWGVPSFVIERLPISEINKQKVYWSINEWGIQDDLLSLIASQQIAHRTKDKPPDLDVVKSVVIEKLKFKPHIVEDTQTLTNKIIGILAPITRDNNV